MSLLLLFGPQSGVAASTGADAKTTVLIGFDTAPGVDPPTWTDVSAYLVQGSTSRGRQKELDDYQSGTATVRLRNEDRRFDPEHSAGPYFGKVLPMKRLHISAEYNGITNSLFDGLIDSWDQVYGDQANNFAEAVVTATDGFKVLSVAELATSAYAQEVIADNPVHWWRLGEPAGATVAFDEIGTADMAVAGTGVFGTAGLIARDSNTAVTFTEATNSYLRATSASPIGTESFTVEFVIKAPAQSQPRIVLSNTEEGDNRVAFQINPLVWEVGGDSVNGISDVDDDVIRHVVGVREAGGNLKIYVNGTDFTSGSGNSLVNLPASDFFISFPLDTFTGVIDEVAIYDTALSTTRIAAHANTITTPWNGDTPAQRMNRILDAVEWPANLRELDTGSSVLQSADIANQSVLDHAKKVNKSEFGNLYMTAEGKVRLEGRNAAVNQASLGTFGDDAGELGYMDLEFDYSDQLLRNDVTVSRNEGVAQNAKDETSITSFLRHSFTRDGLIHNSDTVSRSAAEFYVSEYKNPLLRVTSMTLNPRGSGTTLFPQVLARELTDRITVKRRPQGVGSAISQLSVIEGIQHDFGPKYWITKWSLSPAFGDAVGNFWQIGVVGSSELGTTNRLYF